MLWRNGVLEHLFEFPCFGQEMTRQKVSYMDCIDVDQIEKMFYKT